MMNAKGTRKNLNVAFKQVQRLPDWPLIKMIPGKLLSEECGERNPAQHPHPSRLTDNDSGSRAWAE
jgi:hypothetical protein